VAWLGCAGNCFNEHSSLGDPATQNRENTVSKGGALITQYREPRYNPELNEGLGGTVEFGEEEYLFPRELPAGKVRQILEGDQDAEVYGLQFPGFRVESDDGVQYDLLHLDEEDPVDAIGVYDVDDGEVLDFYRLDELSEVEQ
jgi:hypothetical protein